MTKMTATATAKDLTKAFEGLRLKAYECSADVWTIGYGHTGEMSSPEVYEGDEITLDQANDYFKSDWEEVEAAANRLLEVGIQKRRVTQERFDAFCAFLFNFGEDKAKDYTITKYLNAGRSDAHLADYWVRYRVSNYVHLPGLLRRRMAELCVAHGLPWDVTQGEYEDRYSLETHWQDVYNWALKSMHRRSQTNQPIEKKEPILNKPRFKTVEEGNAEIARLNQASLEKMVAKAEPARTTDLRGLEAKEIVKNKDIKRVVKFDESSSAKYYVKKEINRENGDRAKAGALTTGGVLAVGVLENLSTVENGVKAADGAVKTAEGLTEVTKKAIGAWEVLAVLVFLCLAVFVISRIREGMLDKKLEVARENTEELKI